MGNFEFLRGEWPDLYDPVRRAELAVFSDPRAVRFYARFNAAGEGECDSQNGQCCREWEQPAGGRPSSSAMRWRRCASCSTSRFGWRTYHQKAAPPAGVQFDTAAVPGIKFVAAEKLEVLQAQAARQAAAEAAAEAARIEA